MARRRERQRRRLLEGARDHDAFREVDDRGVKGLVQIHVVRERIERESLEAFHLIAEAAQRLELGPVDQPFRREPRRRAFSITPRISIASSASSGV